MSGRRLATRPDRAFSLVELMFAMAIMAIALFAILSMILQTTAMRESARETEMAKEWVQKKIEEVRSRPFSDLRVNAYQPAAGSLVYTATFTGTAVPSQTPSATGILTVDYTNSKLYEIVASITWKGRQGNGNYSMRSLYSK